MAGATAGAEDIGAEDTVTDGDGGLAWVAVLGLGISVWLLLQPVELRARPLLFLPVLSDPILTTGTTILHRQILTQRPEPNQNGPTRSWGPSAPGGTANANHANSNVAAVAPRRPVVSVDRIGVTPSSYRAARSISDRSTTEWATPQAGAALRPEMQKALQRLREMPPFAREREIETGRYRQFSSEEKQILRNAALPSRATIHDLPDSFAQRASLNSHGPIHDR